MNNNSALSVYTLLLSLSLVGCSQTQLIKTHYDVADKLRPDPNAPLVLAIPGLNVPREKVRQRQHFGHLVEMLAEHNIPAKVIAYDTPEYPLRAVASLGYEETNIATTRVGPAVVNAIQIENSRRTELGLPPVTDVVLFAYSQGAVIANRIVKDIQRFKQKYADFCALYGQEWVALQNDPEFRLYADALEDFLVIRDIKVQREIDFKRDPDLLRFYTRAQEKLQSRTDTFLKYLSDPAIAYPNVIKFDPPNTAKYPKRYVKFRQNATVCFADAAEYAKMRDFFSYYTDYRDVLQTHFRFVSTAGSFFGSPRANKAYGLLTTVAFLKPLAARELEQIKDTRLGSKHQFREAVDLLDMKNHGMFPYGEKDVLFFVGVHQDRGDDFLDQSAAHLANHAVGSIEIADEERKVAVVVDRLPDRTVIPLPVTHFPREGFLGGQTYGAAYMTKDNPVFPYFLNFLLNDWRAVHAKAAVLPIELKQFMLQISFPRRNQETRRTYAVSNFTPNVLIENKFVNSDTDTVVWIGRFTGEDQKMNLTGAEDDTGIVTFEFWEDPKVKTSVDVPVYPGCNTLVSLQQK